MTNSVLNALNDCAAFIAGFEGDELQDGLPETLLARIEMARAELQPLPAENDATGHCIHCGRDNEGHEGEPCSDDCPQYDSPTVGTEAPTGAIERLACPNCGDETHIYTARDFRWNADRGRWEERQDRGGQPYVMGAPIVEFRRAA